MRPGLIALILVAVLGLGLGIEALNEDSVLERAYSQVFIVACGAGGAAADGWGHAMAYRSYGTGWWVNDQGYAVTAYHVVDDCGYIVGMRGGWTGRLELVAYDPELDVALLRAPEPPAWAAGIPLSYDVSIGDEVYVVGYPVQVVATMDGDLARASAAPRILEATIAWLDPHGPLLSFQPGTDAGNSGGPIVSEETGGAVGIVVFARKGVVSSEFYGLRMDALAGFLDENSVDYGVARDSNATLMMGLGAAAAVAAVLLLAHRRGG